MKKFLIKLLLFSSITSIFVITYIFQFAGKDVDPFYRRFTVKKQSSLILGSSRAAQGIEPKILNEKINLENGIYNYAFTVNRSVWGPSHLQAIKMKLSEIEDDKRIFIIECNPWSFFSKPEDIGLFPENNAPPNSIIFPNMNPNIEYFFGGYEFPNLHLLMPKKENRAYINENGRLVLELKYDSAEIKERIFSKLEMYKKKQVTEVLNTNRFKYLEETVDFLSKKGEVFLVRLPISYQMLKIEEKLEPDFDCYIKDIGNCTYINLVTLSNDYITSDGNHIHNRYSNEISKILADSINSHLTY